METQHDNPFLARCVALGIPAWVCDARGEVARAPVVGGDVAARVLNCEPMRGAVTAAARGWLDNHKSDRAELCEGARLVVVGLGAGPSRSEVGVVLLMGPRAISTAFVRECAAAAGLSTAAGGAALTALARIDEGSSSLAEESVRCWARDLSDVDDARRTIEGFTTQLGNAFDTIDFLYSVGKAMRDPTRPEQFLDFVCERLRATMDFDWVAAGFTRDAEGRGVAPPEIADRVFAAGDIPKPVVHSLRAIQQLIERVPGTGAAEVLESAPGLSTETRPQVLAHALVKDGRPYASLVAGGKRGGDPCVSSYDTQLVEAAAGYLTAFLETVTLYAEQKKMFMGTLRALSAAIDAKDRYTRGHSERVAHVSWLLGRASGMPAEQAERIRVAGLVHDVGKIGVPEAVLTKSGKLTEAEFDHIKRHPQIGFGILRDIPQLADVLPGVLHHHERWDGAGYPTGLSGERIPLQARIIAIADTFDAMSSTRSYRPAMPRDRVLTELARSAGTQLDPTLVPVMLSLDLSFYDELVARHAVNSGAVDYPMGEQPEAKAA